MKQTLRSAAQSIIRNLVLTTEFPVVAYDREGAREMPRGIGARTCEINETECSFVTDTNVGTHVAIRPEGWTMTALATFEQEVDLRQGLMQVFNRQILIPAGDDYPPFRITLKRYRVQHPTRMEPNTGSKADITFQIDTIRGK